MAEEEGVQLVAVVVEEAERVVVVEEKGLKTGLKREQVGAWPPLQMPLSHWLGIWHSSQASQRLVGRVCRWAGLKSHRDVTVSVSEVRRGHNCAPSLMLRQGLSLCTVMQCQRLNIGLR